MREKIRKQTVFCVIAVLAIFISENSGIAALEKGTGKVVSCMSVDYSAGDIAAMAAKGAEAVSGLPAKAEKAVDVVVMKSRYGEPVDERYSGENTAVYAVGAGKVSAAGENESIVKYVKISHDSDGESIYGNLDKVLVKVPENVKKGQIIGVYREDSGKDFYYSFRDFD